MGTDEHTTRSLPLRGTASEAACARRLDAARHAATHHCSPGPGGRPAPVVCSVYSLHRQSGLASRPSAMAAVPATPTSVSSAAARTATERRAAARRGSARLRPAGRWGSRRVGGQGGRRRGGRRRPGGSARTPVGGTSSRAVCGQLRLRGRKLRAAGGCGGVWWGCSASSPVAHWRRPRPGPIKLPADWPSSSPAAEGRHCTRRAEAPRRAVVQQAACIVLKTMRCVCAIDGRPGWGNARLGQEPCRRRSCCAAAPAHRQAPCICCCSTTAVHHLQRDLSPASASSGLTLLRPMLAAPPARAPGRPTR